jgi:hypothetical protein
VGAPKQYDKIAIVNGFVDLMRPFLAWHNSDDIVEDRIDCASQYCNDWLD